MATHFSILSWGIPLTEKPGGPCGHKQSDMDWSNCTHTQTHTQFWKGNQTYRQGQLCPNRGHLLTQLKCMFGVNCSREIFINWWGEASWRRAWKTTLNKLCMLQMFHYTIIPCREKLHFVSHYTPSAWPCISVKKCLLNK